MLERVKSFEIFWLYMKHNSTNLDAFAKVVIVPN